MRYLLLLLTTFFAVFFSCTTTSGATDTQNGQTVEAVGAPQQINGTEAMLTSLLEVRKSLRAEIELAKKHYAKTQSETEKLALKQEISHLDKQLSETRSDFERIATGIEIGIFTDQKPEKFSWKEELTTLLEPAIKELKRFTVRARQKTDLKDKIAEQEAMLAAAIQAVQNLQVLNNETKNSEVKKQVEALMPEWLNVQKRLGSKLELTERELDQLSESEASLVESSSDLVKTFFRDRGRYLIIAIVAFSVILIICRLIYRIIIALLRRLNRKKKHRSFQARLIDIVFRVLSVLLAITGLFFVLYLAEDWFLLSMAIIFFLGLLWTVRQGLPRLWQQGRLMLNIGAVRENERLILHGVPWQVASINVFSRLVNPALGVELRVPVEHLIGLVSRPYKQEEPWFPCKKGDWIVVGKNSRARVVSLSHEYVEVVERGGKRIIYPTQEFLQASPVNLSRNFRLRIPFGLSYGLQDQITSTIPKELKAYLEARIEEEGYAEYCLNLLVEFSQANSSSLDLLIIADFDGKVADIYKRLERAFQRWCVDCSSKNGWEIPFPQLTIHQPGCQAGDSDITV